jgi:hypothetical protein
MTHMLRILFDLDPAVYMAAFAAQKSNSGIIMADQEGAMTPAYFTDGREKQAWKRAKLKEGWVVHDEWKDVLPEEEGFARQAARTIIETAITRIKRHYGTDFVTFDFYLTGEGNFREEVATIQPYKGNRKDMVKPVHYQAVRDYLEMHYDAEMVTGMEADDKVSIEAWKSWRDPSLPATVVATIDKDLDQIPGKHYDYKKHVFYSVDPLDGELFFYAQVLAGDATDHIRGLHRWGLKRALSYVNSVYEELTIEDDQEWRTGMWQSIVDEYTLARDKYPGRQAEDMDPQDEAVETARLVYMLQEEDELWQPPELN